MLTTPNRPLSCHLIGNDEFLRLLNMKGSLFFFFYFLTVKSQLFPQQTKTYPNYVFVVWKIITVHLKNFLEIPLHYLHFHTPDGYLFIIAI